MQPMTTAEWQAFIHQGTRTGKLATVRKDGRPHCVPIWFVADGDDLVFTTWRTSLKARNMRRDPRAVITLDNETFPYDFVMIEGTVQLQELSPAELLPYATRIARRYAGPERADEFGRRNAVEGELLVRFTPTRVVSAKGVSN